MKKINSKFVFGKPVSPEKFVGRAREIRTIMSRLENSESSLIVGDPHIGKSSLKRYLVDGGNLESNSDSNKWIFVDIDCHLVPSLYGVWDFWCAVLSRVLPVLVDGQLQDRVKQLLASNFEPLLLQDFFCRLGQTGWQVVLVLDELDSIFDHPSLCSRDFFGPIRTICNNTEGLAVLAASREPLSVLNGRTKSMNGGSPFLNNQTDVRILSLSLEEVSRILDSGLLGTGLQFQLEDRIFVERLAGPHPYLVQAAGATLFDLMAHGVTGPERFVEASDTFRSYTNSHFADFWSYLRPEAQVAIAILALAEAKGQTNGRDFNTKDIADLDRFTPELEDLERRGLIEVASAEERWRWDPGSHAIWRGKRWRIASEGLAWWILESAVTTTRDTIEFREWLRLREKDGLLSKGEMATIQRIGKGLPSVVTDGVQSLLKKFVAGLIGLPT